MQTKPDLQVVRAEPPDEDSIDLVAIGLTLWSGKWLIAACATFGLLVAGYRLANTAPVYLADALIQIEAKSNLLGLPAEVGELVSGSAPSTMAEIEILRSRLVLGRAAASLRFDWQVVPELAPAFGVALQRFALPIPDLASLAPYARVGDSIKLKFLKVPPSWIGRPIALSSTGNAGFVLALPDGSTIEGKAGSLVTSPKADFAVQLEELEAPPGRHYTLMQRSEASAVRDLGATITVQEQGRQTGMLRVSLTAPDPREAERRLDAVISAYVEQNISKSAAEAEKSLAFVQSQIPLAEQSVRDAELALNAFRANRRSIDLAFETQSLLSESSAVEAELRRIALEEEEYRQKFTENHPIYQQLLQTRDGLQQRLEELQRKITALPETQREVVNLTRTLEVAQSTYVQLLNRAQELQVLRASEIGSARIIDTAEARPERVGTSRTRVVALFLLAGIAFGAGLVWLRERLRRGVDSVEEIERAGAPVFATINQIKSRAKARTSPYILTVRDTPNDLSIEAFRSLRTSLHFGLLDASSRSIMLTSAAPGAGKSFCAVNLAAIAAQSGQRVCLVDADMRRGTVHNYFGLARRHAGLADYLAERASLSEVLQSVTIPGSEQGIDVVTTGKLPPNPAELLLRQRFADLVRTLTASHDLVIIDTPPALAVTDAAIVGQAVGASIMVVRHADTAAGDIGAVRKTLETAAVPLTGAIFNGFDPEKARAGGYGYRGYGYGYGYRYARRYAYPQRKEAE